MTDARVAIREEQEADPTLGPFFKALYTFADRTVDECWDNSFPIPVITLDSIGRSKDGFFVPRDGMTFARINLNPTVLRNGADAAECLHHELVHAKLAHEGKHAQRNYHSAEFHELMLQVGILTQGRNGRHVGYTDDNWWWKWLEEDNADLALNQFILPGSERKKKRAMYKHSCPTCHASFRHRTIVHATCTKCGEEFVWQRVT